MSFVWLASYPKSGNTWVRVFLANYLSEDGAGWDWNEELSGLPSHLSRYTFDEAMGVSSADILTEALAGQRRLFHRHFVETSKLPCFVKTHEAFADPNDHAAMFPSTAASKALYLVRNPLDLTASFAHHQKRTNAQIIQTMADAEAKTSTQGLFFDEHMGSWSTHVDGWANQTDIPVCVVRYEDLVAEPFDSFAKIVRFCELDCSETRIEAAIAASSFDRLQNNERESGFKERPPLAESFFRSGKIGGWKTELTADQADQIIADHGEMMQQLGYL